MLRNFLVLLLFVRLACAASIAVTPSATTVVQGQAFHLVVSIDSITDLYAWQFDLTFDPVRLSAVDVTEGPFLASGGPTLFLAGGIDNLAGLYLGTTATLLGPVPGVSGAGTLAIFTFQALSAGQTNVALFNQFLVDSNLFTLDVVPANASVEVLSPEPGAWLLALGGLALLRFGGFARRFGLRVARSD